nr:MAG TPA: helix-turn-helix domain protein [Caudoviricetes sp.]
MKSEISKRIDEVIKKAGGQTAISEKTGIPLKSISNYCLGISPPKLEPLIQIAKATNVSLDWLATGEGSFNKNADMLDKKELILAIETVEESLNATNRTLKPAKKAELILAIYDLFTSENKPSSAQIISILSKIA